MEFKHEPIMLNECLENLNIKEDGTYVDGTLGGAGHSVKILERLTKNGKLIGIDRDEDALCASQKRLANHSNVIYVWGNHENIREHLDEINIDLVDGILLDLGVSSYQIDEGERGFSYTKNARLDMRMNRKQDLDAEYIINNYSKENLEKIFFEYGEENFSKKIANKIVKIREEKKIETTFELADIIRSTVPKNGIDSFKRIFQALRIEVNGELRNLKKAVEDSILSLKDGGRLCIITFHSLEDRIIKNTFIEYEGRCSCPKDFPKCVCGYKSYGRIVTKKPIIPNEEEQNNNPRSKSAKLRVFERIKE